MPTDDFARMLQLSISPVVLINAIGLLLLVMTNRMGRIIDSVRRFNNELGKGGDQSVISRQIDFLFRRAKLMRAGIFMASVAVLFAGVIVILLFSIQFYQMALGAVVATCFVLCIGSLIVATILFLTDISLMLEALKLQLGRE